MDEVRTAVSLLGAAELAGSGSVLDASGSPDDNLRRSVQLFAALPAIVAYDQRRRRGLDVVEPRDDLDYAANFLWMTFGEEADATVVDVFNRSMVLYAEHSFNASTFTARVVTSTLSRPLLRGRRGDRRPQGPLARRRQRGRHAHVRGDRRRRQRQRLAGHRPRGEAQDHGLRAPGLQARRLARADHEGGAREPRASTTTDRTSSTCTARSRRSSSPARGSTRTSTTRPGRPTP